MFAVTVEFRILPGCQTDFLTLVRANAAQSRAIEPGCRQFDVCTDPASPDEVFLYEVYGSPEAFQDHLHRPHFRDFDAAVQGMVAAKTVRTYAQVTQ